MMVEQMVGSMVYEMVVLMAGSMVAWWDFYSVD
jgi:fructose-1,6-bisphosphatase/inositol monophosphatase family enzyme